MRPKRIGQDLLRLYRGESAGRAYGDSCRAALRLRLRHRCFAGPPEKFPHLHDRIGDLSGRRRPSSDSDRR
jgi:hypothetical protein